MKKYIPFLLAFSVAACGGGGSSGAGGGSNPFAGSYVGTATISARAPGAAPITETVAVTIEVDGNGTVRILDSEGAVGAGQLNGNSFSFTNPAIDSDGGITCTGTQTFTGTIADGAISGQISGSFTCAGPGGSVQISLEGTFSVSLIRAAVPVVPYGEFEDGLMGVMRQLVRR